MLSVLPPKTYEYYLCKTSLKKHPKILQNNGECNYFCVCSGAFGKVIEKYSRLTDFNTFKILFLLFKIVYYEKF